VSSLGRWYLPGRPFLHQVIHDQTLNQGRDRGISIKGSALELSVNRSGNNDGNFFSIFWHNDSLIALNLLLMAARMQGPALGPLPISDELA
jgi:hypothetical protein